ncbi:hypothetical protein [Wolbachia endosymbiont of Folsomia candida]|uniref:hypothetical protein n=1 Tax=Wolbachia endosymbiont of Folsomia candida TaxID=169402 RepID=UPI000A549E62|nr:hypothetical protein [Wolbachia endosymbiont of Folsomia candida]
MVLSALIIKAAFLTQTHIILAALIIPAMIGLYGWSLYKEENKPDSKFQEDIEVKNISTLEREAGA